MIRRREFITLLGGAAAAWPVAARGQQRAATRRLGVLMNGAPTDARSQSYVAAFEKVLRELGWNAGLNLHTEYRWNEGDVARMAGHAQELARLAPDVIICASSANLRAVQQATRTIPVVFLQVSEPVDQGFVPSLARPGGNTTGFAAYELSMGGKWVDLLKQIAPGLARVAVMFNPDTSPQSRYFLRSIEAAAPTFGVQAVAMPVRSTSDIEGGLESLSLQGDGGLIFPTDTFTELRGGLIIEQTTRHRLPAIYGSSRYPSIGGLMFYGPDLGAQWREAAKYVDRILRGAKPGDLPVQAPTRYALIINLKTARAIGVELPMSLMLRADEVIE
jgi:putative ABC transport system substrate-binding protein